MQNGAPLQLGMGDTHTPPHANLTPESELGVPVRTSRAPGPNLGAESTPTPHSSASPTLPCYL